MNRPALLLLTACGRVGFGAQRDAAAPADDAAPLTYRAAVIADQPLAYWRLGDLGTTARDEMSSFDGTYLGTCQHGVIGAIAGDSDLAIGFDGNTCCVALGTVLDFSGMQAFTVEAWVDSAATGDSFQQIFAHETRSVGPDDGYSLVYSLPPTLYLERAVASSNLTTSRTPFTANAFHHVAGTYDGAMMRTFLDGAQVGMIGEPRSASPLSTKTYLGCATPGTDRVAGTLDDIAVYDHALEPSRIALHHDIGVLGPR